MKKAISILMLIGMVLGLCACAVSDSGSRVEESGSSAVNSGTEQPTGDTLWVYHPWKEVGTAYYDKVAAAACMQGLYNRANGPALYIIYDDIPYSQKWLDVFSGEGEWLHDRSQQEVEDFNSLIDLTKSAVKGVVIWDTDVPATFNVAFTIAGVEDRVVLSPNLYGQIKSKYADLDVVDLRGRFDGSETGSAKNDAYRWAIREYLEKGKCSDHFLALYEDSYFTRYKADIAYVCTRDWSIYNRAFVYDLSPWPDETPADDPRQPVGTDYETHKMILQAQKDQMKGEGMTEQCGFFSFEKYSEYGSHESQHVPVATEWANVWLISSYNIYQNTACAYCLNQSLHAQFGVKQLKQHPEPEVPKLENKVYLCFQMCDYDSAQPLYSFMPDHWADEARGEIPLAWGVNPNLMESYPDVIDYFYRTASPNDTFVADASAAGYFNPSQVAPEDWDIVVEHNKKFYDLADISMSPMVLDQVQPSDLVKDMFAKFSPNGYATMLMNLNNESLPGPEPHVWKGMTVDNMTSIADNSYTPEQAAHNVLTMGIPGATADAPAFAYLRIIWVSPTRVKQVVAELERMRPDLDFELVDPYTYFQLRGQYLTQQGKVFN